MTAPKTPPKKSPADGRQATPLRPAAAPKQDKRKARIDGVLGPFQLAAGAALTVAASTKGETSDAWKADGATLIQFSQPFAEAAADLAEKDDRIAALLDRAAETGPYGAILFLAFQMGAQFAANHGYIKPGRFGTADPNVLIDTIIGGNDDVTGGESGATAKRA
jgi:hypothetical protein